MQCQEGMKKNALVFSKIRRERYIFPYQKISASQGNARKFQWHRNKKSPQGSLLPGRLFAFLKCGNGHMSWNSSTYSFDGIFPMTSKTLLAIPKAFFLSDRKSLMLRLA